MRMTILVACCALAIAAAFAANTIAEPPAEPSGPMLTQAAKYDVSASRDAMVEKSVAFLKTQYNKPPSPDDPSGLLSGWGPKSMNVPYTALVLHGLVGTKAWNADDAMIKDSMTWLIESQETSGGWSYMPGIEKLKGVRAVYITSICAQLFADVDKAAAAGNPWKGKLATHIASARDYLRQSQVGNADGPAPDYKKDNAGYGGWAYSKEEIDKAVKKGGKPPANMSTSTFAIDALKACGLSEDDPLWEQALVFLKRNQNAGEVQEEGFEAVDKATGKKIKPAEKGSDDYGGAVYSEETSMAEGSQENKDGSVTLFSYGSMTYNLLRAYLFAGLPKDSLPVKLAYGWIQRNYTLEKVPGFRDAKQHEMGIYYYYLSMAKTLEAWGEDVVEEPERGFKHAWREDLVKQFAKRQKEDGSWVNAGNDRWQENSPVLCTAYALNALRHTK